MNTKVSIGPTTIVGWLSSLVAILPILVKAVEAGQVAFNGPERYLAIFAITVGAVTQIGRMLQAHALIKAGK